MKIKREHVKKFMKIYEKTFQEKIDYQEAFNQCSKLVLLLNIIYQPMTLKELKIIQNRRRQTGDLKSS